MVIYRVLKERDSVRVWNPDHGDLQEAQDLLPVFDHLYTTGRMIRPIDEEVFRAVALCDCGDFEHVERGITELLKKGWIAREGDNIVALEPLIRRYRRQHSE